MPRYSPHVRMSAISLYARGFSAMDVSQRLQKDMGVSPTATAILKWCEAAGVKRSRVEAWQVSEKHWAALEKFKTDPRVKANLVKLNAEQRGENHPRWKGDKVTKVTQHRWRAPQDYPIISGPCELCGNRKASDRMRIDHSQFPYHKELVVLACSQCNHDHDWGQISITFQNPYDGNLYCIVKDIQVIRI